MLDTKTLKEDTIKECRVNEAWLKTKVEEYAPKGTTCKIEELRVNDVEGDEYIFCEVTITCNKRKHHFNYYAGTQGVTLVERLGGKKGEIADGDTLGKMFEMEFYIPSKDDMEELEEFLANLADYAPKKPKKSKAKKEKEPKLILIAMAQIDCTSGDGVTAYARACKSKKEAAEWIESDFNEEAECHDWETITVTEKDIRDGKEFKSPIDDSDHDYVWKIIFQY
jgi:hypothetical protein